MDRAGEVVVARGMNDSQFAQNPLVTLGHAYWMPPVGKSLWRKRVRDGELVGIKAKTRYPERPGSWPEGEPSPPARLRPFHVLSTGQQFRATMARLLAEFPALAVCDEFTSVVDRTVAQIGSAAIAKTVRARNQRFVAVTCHEDVIDWLQPDWTYYPATNAFQWRCLRRRPPIELEVFRCHHAAWELFAPHHYLAHSLALGANCFLACWNEHTSSPRPGTPGRGAGGEGRMSRPVAFSAWLPLSAPALPRAANTAP